MNTSTPDRIFSQSREDIAHSKDAICEIERILKRMQDVVGVVPSLQAQSAYLPACKLAPKRLQTD